MTHKYRIDLEENIIEIIDYSNCRKFEMLQPLESLFYTKNCLSFYSKLREMDVHPIDL